MNLNILTEEQQELLLNVLATTQKAVVIGHKSPDGDALGSCLSWASILRTVYNVEATVVVPDAYPDFLQWLPESQTIVRYDKHQERVQSLFANADTVFCLDFNVSSRIGDVQLLLDSFEGKKVMIDHHLDPILENALIISHPEMSATSELVFRIVWQLGLFERANKKWAEQIYCGMMTDTGGFTFNSTRPEIFFVICQLLTFGIDKDKIYRNVYWNYSSWAIRLRGYIMNQKLNVFEDLHASYYALSKMDLEEYRYQKGDAEGLVNIPLSIKGMKLSISLREDDRLENTIWVSIRSVDDFPANKVAAEFFNGGGHINAAGGKFNGTLKEACEQAKLAIRSYAEMLKGS